MRIGVVPLKSIKMFEENINNISINVCGYENGEVVGLYYLTKKNKHHYINLTLLHDGEQFHYIQILKMPRLLRNQLTKHENKINICDGCLQHFNTHKILEEHKKECGGIVTILPEEDNNKLQFTNFYKKERLPFTVYTDAESILEYVCWGIIQGKKAVKAKKHIPCAFSYNLHCSFDNSLNKFKSFSGPNAANDFLENLIKHSKYIFNNYLTKTRPMNWRTLIAVCYVTYVKTS
uniref:C2H2-type domain-containing protein n=1 Tax=Musca domestica TaxID=7370 RepID=A0A1I8NL44_MUSDO